MKRVAVKLKDSSTERTATNAVSRRDAELRETKAPRPMFFVMPAFRQQRRAQALEVNIKLCGARCRLLGRNNQDAVQLKERAKHTKRQRVAGTCSKSVAADTT